jgi:hypothetical protein
LILMGPLFLQPSPLLRFVQVVAGGAAGYGAEYGVMMGVMAGDAARHGARQAADGLSARGGGKQSNRASRGKQEAHGTVLPVRKRHSEKR